MSSLASKIVEYKIANTDSIRCVAFSPTIADRGFFATGSDHNKIQLWNIPPSYDPSQSQSSQPSSPPKKECILNKPLGILGGNTSPIVSMAFHPEELQLVSGSNGGSVKLYDLNQSSVSSSSNSSSISSSSSKPTHSLHGHFSTVTSVCYHSQNDTILGSGSEDTNVRVWDVRIKHSIFINKGHTSGVTCVRFSPDGQWVVSSSKDGTIDIWDLVAGKNIQSFHGVVEHKNGSVLGAGTGAGAGAKAHPVHLTFHKERFILGAITEDNTVRLFDLEQMEQIGLTPKDSSGKLYDILFHNYDYDCNSSSSSSSSSFNFLSVSQNGLKSWSWDNPDSDVRSMDSETIHWGGTVGDTILRKNKQYSDDSYSCSSELLVGTFARNTAHIWRIDIDQMHPFHRMKKIHHASEPLETSYLQTYPESNIIQNANANANAMKDIRFAKDPISCQKIEQAEMFWNRKSNPPNFGSESNKLISNRISSNVKGSDVLNPSEVHNNAQEIKIEDLEDKNPKAINEKPDMNKLSHCLQNTSVEHGLQLHSSILMDEVDNKRIESHIQKSVDIQKQLETKLEKIYELKQQWDKPDISQCIAILLTLASLDIQTVECDDLLCQSDDLLGLSVITDFLRAIDWKCSAFMTLDLASKILPLLWEMILFLSTFKNKEKPQNDVAISPMKETVIHSICDILESFGTYVSSTVRAAKSNRNGSIRNALGVDMAGEARLSKCIICFEIFEKLREFTLKNEIVDVSHCDINHKKEMLIKPEIISSRALNRLDSALRAYDAVNLSCMN